MKQRLLLSLCAILCSVATWALTFSQGQFFYSVSGGSVDITGYNSSYSSSQLQNLVIPNSVTYGGTTYRVSRVSNLGGSSYPKTLRVEYGENNIAIAKDAFKGCSNLTTVELTSCVSGIAADAFMDCPKLTDVYVSKQSAYNSVAVFNKNVKVHIPYSADYNAHKASAIFGSSDVTLVQDLTPYDFKAEGCALVVNGSSSNHQVTVAFRIATTSTTWEIPASVAYGGQSWKVVSISPKANNVADSNLKTLIVRSPLTSIGVSAFQGNKNLTSVTISGLVDLVDSYAFKNCSSLATTQLAGIKQLGAEVFSGCTSLKTLNFGAASIQTLDNTALTGITNLENIEINNTKYKSVNGWLYNNSQSTLLFCPPASTQNGWVKTVKSIGAGAFAGTKQTEVLIPYGVTTINQGTFEGSTSLKRAVIPSSVTSWATTNAFKGCTTLQYVICNMKSMPTAYETTFASSNVKNAYLVVYTGLVNTYKSANYWKQFKEFSDLAFDIQSGKVAYTVTSSTTAKVSVLQTNTIPATVQDAAGNSYSVTTIGDDAAKDVLTISGTVTGPNIVNVGARAFYGCKNLTAINLPKVQTIGEAAFYHCDNLQTVTLPVSMTSIAKDVFQYCGSLKAIRWPLGVKDILGAQFVGCSSLEVFEAPYGVQTIGEGCFQSCTKLYRVLLPSTVKSVGMWAFKNCPKMGQVIVNAKTPPTKTGSGSLFDGSTESYLRVPVGCVQQYKNNSAWKAAFRENRITAGGYDFTTCQDFGLSVTALPTRNNGQATAVYRAGAFSDVIDMNTSVTDAWERTFDITAVGDSLFAGSTHEPSKIYFPSNVTKLPPYCFAYATVQIDFIDIYAANMTEIGEYAYAYSAVSTMDRYRIDDKIKVIGDYAFKGCSGLYRIDLSRVTSLGEGVFQDSYINDVTMPVSMTKIGAYCFRDCKRLHHLRWPLGVTTIPNSVFLGSGMKTFEAPYGVTKVEEAAFANCSELTKVVLPSTVTTIGLSALYECDKLTDLVWNCTAPEAVDPFFGTHRDGTKLVSNVSNAYLRVPLQSLEKYKNRVLIATQFKDGHITAGGYDFLGSSNLALTVNKLPSGSDAGTTTAVYKAHEAGDNTDAIDLSVNCKDAWDREFRVTSLSDSCFAGTLAGHVTLPKTIDILPNHCFDGCFTLTSFADIDMPGVEFIGNYVFAHCQSFNPKTLPEKIQTLGDGAFQECTAMTEMTLPATLTYAGNMLFQGCTKLEKVKLSPSLPRLGHRMFHGCESLKSVDIPWGVKTLGTMLFWACSSLEDVHIPSSVTTVELQDEDGLNSGGMFFYCKQLKKVVMNIRKPLKLSASDDALFGNDIGTSGPETSAKFYVPKGCAAAYRNSSFYKKVKDENILDEDGSYDFVNELPYSGCVEYFTVKKWYSDINIGEAIFSGVVHNGNQFQVVCTERTDDYGREFNITEIADSAFCTTNPYKPANIYNIRLGHLREIGNSAFRGITWAAQHVIMLEQENNELLTIGDYAFADVQKNSHIIFDGPESENYQINMSFTKTTFADTKNGGLSAYLYLPLDQIPHYIGEMYDWNPSNPMPYFDKVCVLYRPKDRTKDYEIVRFPVPVDLTHNGLKALVLTIDSGKPVKNYLSAVPANVTVMLYLDKDKYTEWWDRYWLGRPEKLPEISGQVVDMSGIGDQGVPRTAQQSGFDVYVYNDKLDKLVKATSDEAQGISDGYYVELPTDATGGANTITPEEQDLTGIRNVEATGRTADGRLYNLRGQRVDRPTKKGIYIVGGRKVIVK